MGFFLATLKIARKFFEGPQKSPPISEGPLTNHPVYFLGPYNIACNFFQQPLKSPGNFFDMTGWVPKRPLPTEPGRTCRQMAMQGTFFQRQYGARFVMQHHPIAGVIRGKYLWYKKNMPGNFTWNIAPNTKIWPARSLAQTQKLELILRVAFEITTDIRGDFLSSSKKFPGDFKGC